MFHLNSPFIVKYFGSYLRGSELWISMEYVGGGSVCDLLKRKPLSEREIRYICCSVLYVC